MLEMENKCQITYRYWMSYIDICKNFNENVMTEHGLLNVKSSYL